MKKEIKEKLELYSRITVCAAGAIALALAAGKYLLPLVAPFLIAWGIAFMTRPIAAAISSVTGAPVRLIRPILALVLLASIMGALSYLLVKLAGEAWQLLSGIGESSVASEVIRRLFEAVSDFFGESEAARALYNLAFILHRLGGNRLCRIGSRLHNIPARNGDFIGLFLCRPRKCKQKY